MRSKRKPVIYTFGHSRHAIEAFIALLTRNRIDRVVDVRGQPHSRYNPQFNRERLAKSLNAQHIDYVWRGEHLSGRPKEARFYGSNGEVLWEKLKCTPQFEQAVDDLVEEARSSCLVLVCAEEDPRRCHRRFLLTPPLLSRKVEVLHLRGDGRVESDSEIGAGEAQECYPGQPDLFD